MRKRGSKSVGRKQKPLAKTSPSNAEKYAALLAQADAQIQPRGPGLPPRLHPSHAELVDRATEDLRRMLRDPYYYEALQRLLKTGDLLVAKRIRLPYKGKLARRYQGEDGNPQSPKLGRKSQWLSSDAAQRLAKAALKRGMSPMAVGNKLATMLRGTPSEKARFAKQIAQKIYYAQRVLKKRQP